MKILRYLFMTACCLVAVANVAAQTIVDGEAFYIYRNDGDFDGFFYDQVQEIRYSKYDLDSVEQAWYVVQDIVTADSIFRIPLSAIDSIGFVQPEIKFNPRARHMDVLGMSQYIMAFDSTTLIFQKSLPSELMPSKDDVLVGFAGPLEGRGFAGRVVSVDQSSSVGTVVICSPVEKMSDIFEQFITVEMAGVAPETGQVMRRVAGYNEMRRAISGGASLTLSDFNLNGHIPLYDGAVTIDLSSNLKVTMCGIFQIINDSYFIKLRTVENYSLSAGVTLSVSQEGGVKLGELVGPGVPLAFIPFPAFCPIFEISASPDLVVNWSGSINAKATFPALTGQLWQEFTIDNMSEQYIKFTKKEKGDIFEKKGFFSESQYDLQLNGTLQFGIQSVIKIGTLSLVKKVFDLGIYSGVVIGPKVDGSINISLNNVFSGDGVYSLKDCMMSYSSLSLDYDVKGLMSVGKKTKDYKFIDGNVRLMPFIDMYLFPSVDTLPFLYDEKKMMLNAGITTDERQVFWPQEVGMGIYPVKTAAEPNFIYSHYDRPLQFGFHGPESVEMELSTKTIKPGVYYWVPLIKAFGMETPIKSLRKRFTVAGETKLSQDNIKMKGTADTYNVAVEKSEDSQLYVSKFLTDVFNASSWFEALVTDNNKVTLNVEKNESFYEREDSVHVYTCLEGDEEESSVFEDETTLHFVQDPTIPRSYFTDVDVVISIPYIDSNGEECTYTEGIALNADNNYGTPECSFTWSGNRLTVKCTKLSNYLPGKVDRCFMYNYIGIIDSSKINNALSVNKKSIELVFDLEDEDAIVLRKCHISGDITFNYYDSGSHPTVTPTLENHYFGYKANWTHRVDYSNSFECLIESAPGAYSGSSFVFGADLGQIKELSCTTSFRWRMYEKEQCTNVNSQYNYETSEFDYTWNWYDTYHCHDDQGNEYSSFGRFENSSRPDISIRLFNRQEREGR